jgi:hypothetical protein
MQIGNLDKYVSLYSATATTSASGQEKLVPTLEIALFANVNYKEGAEGYQANQKTATRNVIFTVHNILASRTTLRWILFEGLYYSVESVTPIEDDFYLQIVATAIDNNNPLA